MSKRVWHHPEIPAGETTVAWRSAGQLEDTAEFRQWLDREFPQGASELASTEVDEPSRRSFLKLMGASTALAGFGMVACRRPETYIVPYTKAPEWVIPGKATFYASAMPRAQGATPLVVTTHEGRPTKLAPNHLHPDAEGADAFASASVLDLYSPSRSRQILKAGKTAARADLEAVIVGLAKDKSAKIGFLYGADDSPTRVQLTKDLAGKFSAAKFYQYEALTGEAAQEVLGDGVRLVADFAKADRIVSLDCDFAGTDSQGPTGAFFNRRKPEGKDYSSKPDATVMNRLYSVEAAFTLTGGMADHRLRVSPSQVGVVAAQIARGLGLKTVAAPALAEAKHSEWVAELVEDLKSAAGKSMVLAGSRQSLAVHQLAFAINQALGNIGEGKPLKAVQTATKGLGTLTSLQKDIEAGVVDTLVVLTPSNPVYDAPADLNFAASFGKLKMSIHLGSRTDATAHAATWHLPAAHYLESWTDARSNHGVYTVVQPMILPLYPDCVSELELLLALLSAEGKLLNGEGEKGAASPAYTAVRATFAKLGGEGDTAWKTLLRDGFLAGSAYPVVTPKSQGEMALAVTTTAPTADSLEVIFATDSSVFDGRWLDNGWLQEAPDPVSKLTWDNVALVAPKTAKALGIYKQIVGLETDFASRSPDDEGEKRKSPMILLDVNGKSLEIAVLVSFGQAENTIVIPLGYGQGFDEHDELKRGPQNASHVGLVGMNRGFNAYPLRTTTTPYFATGGKVTPTEKRYSVALTQEHSAMYGRALAREISTLEDEEKGSFVAQLENVAKQGNDAHAPPNVSLYKSEDRNGKPLLSDTLHQWGMSIDLSSCMGCNACLVACQAENNIPIVGKEQVARGREMHWIRMDRYFATQKDNTFDEDNPELVPQPVACVQCEAAPCETVCPVNATIHTEDGLNAMAYNRCIGTRYCANNCPYKARRFNYFDYNKRNPLISHNLYKGPFGVKQVGEAPHLQKNPNVTVRMRGVMEKCTYCVQRLKDAVIRQKGAQKQEALVAGKPSTEMQVTTSTLRIPVDSVRVACQDACVAGAITFGNLLDGEKSAMYRSKHIERNYDLLNYIGTWPRTSYLARVKNPNPKMPDAKFIGKATIHMA
jgi:MoCo/4Fe-4S cofactor protein with predicted Tat translocation signal